MADEDKNYNATIISSDKDLLQLINDHVKVKLLKMHDYIMMDKKEFLNLMYSIEITQYNTDDFWDYYQKQRPDGKTIIAIENGNGVILHLGDEDGNIMTRIEQPAIHPSKQVDNPNDLPTAEQALCKSW